MPRSPESSRPQTAAGTAGVPVRVALLIALAAALPALAQPGGMPPTPVGVTAVRSAPVRPLVQLPGSVEARTSAVVASEVAGLVVELRAREGERVERGAVLARLRRDNLERDLEAERARLAEAEARRELAEHRLTRARDLFESGVISRQDLDDAVSESGAWKGRADVSVAEIARLETLLSRSVVRAPFAGVVVAEHCEQGEWVAEGGPVIELVDPTRLEVLVNLPERYFAGVREGGEARVRLDSLPELDVAGRIVAVIPRADARARTFPVKVAFDNPDRRIGVGMTATVAFATGAARLATVVPKDAVVREGAQRLVYRVDAGDGGASIVTPVTVKLGAASGAWIEVQGVSAGERVVTRGNERLFPGSPVVPEPVEYEAP